MSRFQTHPWELTANWELKKQKQCSSTKVDELCQDPEFLSKTCESYNLQSMKSTRLRLTPAENLLNDSRFANSHRIFNITL
jgi:hypothetical protein